MGEVLGGRGAAGAGAVREFTPSGGMCGQVAFTCSHLMYSARDKLVQPHEGVWGESGLVGVIIGGWVMGRPVGHKGVAGSLLEGGVRLEHELGWGYVCPGRRGSVEDHGEACESFKKGDDKVTHGVYGEVFPDGRCGDRGGPVKGEVHGRQSLGEVA